MAEYNSPPRCQHMPILTERATRAGTLVSCHTSPAGHYQTRDIKYLARVTPSQLLWLHGSPGWSLQEPDLMESRMRSLPPTFMTKPFTTFLHHVAKKSHFSIRFINH